MLKKAKLRVEEKKKKKKESRVERGLESPHPLTEPYLRLSPHTALTNVRFKT
jgi:hypothetical protein